MQKTKAVVEKFSYLIQKAIELHLQVNTQSYRLDKCMRLLLQNVEVLKKDFPSYTSRQMSEGTVSIFVTYH